MTGIKYLLDTNIVIGLLKGNEAVIQLLEQTDCSLSECVVSQITGTDQTCFTFFVGWR